MVVRRGLMERPDTASQTQTVSAGQTATWQIVASDGGEGYSGAATFTCSGAPTGADCTVTPAHATIGVSATALTVTVTTTSSLTAAARPQRPGSLALCLLLGGALTGKRRRKQLALFAALTVLALSSVSCGGAGSGTSGSGTTPIANATPAGTYALTVTATAGSAQTSHLLTLVVQ